MGNGHDPEVTFVPKMTRARRPRTTLSACNVPNFEGPQIQDPPQGFLLAPDSYQQRRLFPQHELVFHATWVESTSTAIRVSSASMTPWPPEIRTTPGDPPSRGVERR